MISEKDVQRILKYCQYAGTEMVRHQLAQRPDVSTRDCEWFLEAVLPKNLGLHDAVHSAHQFSQDGIPIPHFMTEKHMANNRSIIEDEMHTFMYGLVQFGDYPLLITLLDADRIAKFAADVRSYIGKTPGVVTNWVWTEVLKELDKVDPTSFESVFQAFQWIILWQEYPINSGEIIRELARKGIHSSDTGWLEQLEEGKHAYMNLAHEIVGKPTDALRSRAKEIFDGYSKNNRVVLDQFFGSISKFDSAH